MKVRSISRREPPARRRKPASKRARLSSVANALRVVKAFSDQEHELGISELARRLGLAKSTVHRLATTLTEEGFLEQANGEGAAPVGRSSAANGGKYRLGLLLFELGSQVRRKMDVSAEARPALRLLAEKTGETVHLAILDHLSVLYVNRIESHRAIRSGFGLGTRAPIHCTAMGKALLAFQEETVIAEVLRAGLPPSTPRTITDAKTFQRELENVRARGYATEDEEIEAGLRSLAAPVLNDAGQVVAAIGVSGPAQRLTKEVMAACAAHLVSATDFVSQRLGYQPLPRKKRA
jgi:DNA-binding IclR family transcriptional regulator